MISSLEVIHELIFTNPSAIQIYWISSSNSVYKIFIVMLCSGEIVDSIKREIWENVNMIF